LNDDTDAGGLVAFVEPPKIEFLEASGVEPPDEELVAPHEGEAEDTATEQGE